MTEAMSYAYALTTASIILEHKDWVIIAIELELELPIQDAYRVRAAKLPDFVKNIAIRVPLHPDEIHEKIIRMG